MGSCREATPWSIVQSQHLLFVSPRDSIDGHNRSPTTIAPMWTLNSRNRGANFHARTGFQWRLSCDCSGSDECRCVRHPRLSAAFEVYRDSYTPDAFADTIPTPETLQVRLQEMTVFVAKEKSGGDRRHDCLWFGQPGRRPHSRNGDTPHCARQWYCRWIVDARGSAFPPKKLQPDQSRYDRTTQAGHPVLRKVWFLSVWEDPGLVWFAFIRVRQNHLIRCDRCNYWGSHASHFLTRPSNHPRV